MKKLYIVRYFVQASSINEAIKQAKADKPTDVFIAEEWFSKVGFLKHNPKNPPNAIGFSANNYKAKDQSDDED